MTPIILASKSPARAALLAAAGVAFTARAPGVDEEAIKSAMLAEAASPRDIADILAETKAVRVSGRVDGLVIGADSTVDLGGALVDKAQTMAEARARLLSFRGRSHLLHSAVVVARDGRPIWREVKSAKMGVRDFSEDWLDGYLAREGEALLGSVGCYRLEGEGVQLFDRIDGDYFAILGLPMIGLLDLCVAMERWRLEDRMSLLSGKTLVGGVVGYPVAHSLSPRIHSQWIADAGLDAVYAPFPVPEGGFVRFCEAMRGGVIRGVNVTIPFKEDAKTVADEADVMSRRAGASNLLLFHSDGRIEARNTDGEGMVEAIREDGGFDFAKGPVVVLGAGGAARGAGAALIAAGVPELRLVNRTWSRAAGLAEAFPYTYPFEWADMARAFDGATLVVNATAGGLNGEGDLDVPLHALPDHAVAMDMVYKPLETGFLRLAKARGLRAVDGLSMLINQAKPSFEALYGQKVPPQTDARAVAMAMLT